MWIALAVVAAAAAAAATEGEPTAATVLGSEIRELRSLIALQEKKVKLLEKLRSDVLTGRAASADGTCELPTDYLTNWEESGGEGSSENGFDDYLIAHSRFEVRFTLNLNLRAMQGTPRSRCVLRADH